MKKLITVLLLLFSLFSSMQSVNSPLYAPNENRRENAYARQTSFDISETGQNSLFTSANMLSLLKQNCENVKTINLNSPASFKTVHGFDKIFQQWWCSKNNQRRYSNNNRIFLLLFSYRQIQGYYLYHLCKLLH